MKKVILCVAFLSVLSFPAFAEVNLDVNLGGPGYVAAAPAYVAPYPTYYDPHHSRHDFGYWQARRHGDWHGGPRDHR